MIENEFWPVNSPPPKYKPEYAKIVMELARIGATNMEIIRHLKINSEVLLLWAMVYPDFEQAMAANEEARSARIEDAMFQRALGYDVPYEKVYLNAKGNVMSTERGTKHFPPDPISGYKWLGARKPDKWAKSGDEDKGELKITVTGGLPPRKMS